MTDEQLIEFKKLSMQEGKLNLSWFADYVENAVRKECATLVRPVDESLADEILGLNEKA